MTINSVSGSSVKIEGGDPFGTEALLSLDVSVDRVTEFGAKKDGAEEK